MWHISGTPLDSRTVDLEPKSLSITNNAVIAANDNVIYFWQFKVNTKLTVLDLAQASNFRRKDKNERYLYLQLILRNI